MKKLLLILLILPMLNMGQVPSIGGYQQYFPQAASSGVSIVTQGFVFSIDDPIEFNYSGLSLQDGDIIILTLYNSWGSSFSNPTSGPYDAFTLKAEDNNSSVWTEVWYRRYTSSDEGQVRFDASESYGLDLMYVVVRGAVNSGDPFDYVDFTVSLSTSTNHVVKSQTISTAPSLSIFTVVGESYVGSWTWGTPQLYTEFYNETNISSAVDKHYLYGYEENTSTGTINSQTVSYSNSTYISSACYTIK